jgi:hypothetical protein
VALRQAGSDVFVLSGKRSADGNAWQQVSFSAAQLAALNQDAVYTLDLIDAGDGGWGWVNLDSVNIPGLPVPLQPPALAIGWVPGGQVRISWPAHAAGYFLQRSTAAGTDYVNAGLPVTTEADEFVAYDNTPAAGAQFYRLIRQQ